MGKLVSIVMPNYNYSMFIRQALDSALAQTYENIEIIVVDDKSTDNSLEIIEEYVKKDSRVKSYPNKKNLGVVASHNRCLELAKGEYVVVLSSDDYLHPDFVKECVDYLDKYPTAGMVSSDVWYVDNDGTVTSPEPFYPESFFCKGQYQCKVWLFTNTFVPSQVLFRKEAVLDPEIGGAFSYLADTFIDTELWFRLCLKYDFVYMKKKLAYYRMHMGSFSKSYENMKYFLQFYLSRKRFGELIRSNEYLAPHAKEAVKRTMRIGTRCLRTMLEAGDYKVAKQYLCLVEGLDPDVVEMPYYDFVMKCIENQSCEDMDTLRKLENEYAEICKAPENRGKNGSAPYDLPEEVEIIEAK